MKAKIDIFLAIWRVPPMIRVYPSSEATVDSKLATLKFLEILEKESNWLWIISILQLVKTHSHGVFEQIVLTIIIFDY